MLEHTVLTSECSLSSTVNVSLKKRSLILNLGVGNID